MKKVYKFKDEKKDEERVVEAIKHDIRKYIKREKKKSLPDKKTMYWDFDCKIGKSVEEAKEVIVEELIKELDAIKAKGATECYIEIIAKVVDKPVKIEEPTTDSE